MEMKGKIVKRGNKYVFVPLESVLPGEEEIFPGIEATQIRVRPAPAYGNMGAVRPTPSPITPKEAEKIAAKTAEQAIKSVAAAKKGILITRPGASLPRTFYHRRSYMKDFAGKSRVIFFDETPDPDGLITNVPEAYFKSQALFTSIMLEIEPSILEDTDDTYGYRDAIQALTQSTIIIRVNDTNLYTFSFKEIAPNVDTKITAIGTSKHTIFEFEPAKPKELADLLKADYIQITSKDRLSVLIVSATSFPALGAGAKDFTISPILFGRAVSRLIGG